MGSGGAGRTLGVIPRSRQQLLTLIAITLTFASGANDVFAFTRLGGVFTSVMTGNIVFFGLAVAERSVSLASHTAVAIAGYIMGVVVATWVSHGVKKRSASGSQCGQRAAQARELGAVVLSWCCWPGRPSDGRSPAPGRAGGRSSRCSR